MILDILLKSKEYLLCLACLSPVINRFLVELYYGPVTPPGLGVNKEMMSQGPQVEDTES